MKTETIDRFIEKYFFDPFADLLIGLIQLVTYIGFYYVLYLIIRAIL